MWQIWVSPGNKGAQAAVGGGRHQQSPDHIPRKGWGRGKKSQTLVSTSLKFTIMSEQNTRVFIWFGKKKTKTISNFYLTELIRIEF